MTPCLSALAVSAALALAAPSAPDAVFRGDLAHTGVYRSVPLEQFGGVEWRVQTGGMVQSTPAVVGGTLYVGSGDGHLYAVDAATGKLAWRADHEMSWVNSSPAVARGLVVAGSSDNHFVQAVHAATGRERWRFATDRLVWSSPAVAGGLVYWTTGEWRGPG